MTLALQQRRSTRRHLRTLDDLIAYGNDLDDARRASLFEYGDLISEYVAAHANGAGDSPRGRPLPVPRHRLGLAPQRRVPLQPHPG